MAKTRASILNKAKSYIGYKEDRYGYSKFNYWFYGYKSKAAWCGTFVWCIFKKCGARELISGVTNPAYVPSWMSWAKKNGIYKTGTSGIQKGDLLLFEFDGDPGADHIGIYEKTVDGYIYSIDGNTGSTSQGNGGTVDRRNRAKKYVKGYIKIDYPTTKYKGFFPTKTVNKKTGSKKNTKRWQKFLCWYGADVEIDGDFGKDTEAKTKIFQRKVGLVADGSAGPKTIAEAKACRK